MSNSSESFWIVRYSSFRHHRLTIALVYNLKKEAPSLLTAC